MPCIRCQRNGSIMCGGHCGLCFEEAAPTPAADGHPSERDHEEEEK